MSLEIQKPIQADYSNFLVFDPGVRRGSHKTLQKIKHYVPIPNFKYLQLYEKGDITQISWSSSLSIIVIIIISFTELRHLLTRSGLTYPKVSSKVYHDSFCQLGSSISLPWVIYFEAFYLHVVSSFSCIPIFFFYSLLWTVK